MIQKKSKENMAFGLIAILICGIYLWNSMVGFRWPSLFVMTNHVVNCKFGFVPRTLIGTICIALFGELAYKKIFLYVLILGVAALFICFISYLVIRLIAVEHNIFAVFFFFIYAIGPYTKYYIHEAGYFEQYGFLLGMLLLWIAKKKKWLLTAIAAAVFALISVLISETNLFLIIPFMFSIPLLMIVEERTHWFRRTFALGMMFVPSVIYSLGISLYLVPENQMYQIINDNRRFADFPLREDVYWYFVFDRSSEDVWGRTLHAIPVQLILFPLLIVFMTWLILLKIDKLVAIVYVLLSIGCGLASYITVIVSWDVYRYYFCIYIQIMFVTLYVMERYFKKVCFSRKECSCMCVLGLLGILMSTYRMELFDYARYLNTLDEMIYTITNFIQT